MAPPTNSDYNKIEYWDSRYESEDDFDWCKKYNEFGHLIDKYVNYNDSILIIGCGNSSLSEDLYNNGYKNITNIDYSRVVISKMKDKNEITRQMKWMVMDATNMEFNNDKFDIIIEKATLDALLVNEKDPWNTSLESQNLMHKILLQISGLLKENGKFISITFAQPHFRCQLYCKEEYNWSYTYDTYGDGFAFYFYTMIKGQQLDPKNISKININKNNQTTKVIRSNFNIVEDENFLFKLSEDL